MVRALAFGDAAPRRPDHGPRDDLEKPRARRGHRLRRRDHGAGYHAGALDRPLRERATVVFRAGAQTVPLTSDKVKIAKLLADPTAAWRSENAEVAAADPTFGAVTIQCRGGSTSS